MVSRRNVNWAKILKPWYTTFFILNMSNKEVQKSFCDEPKQTPEEALQNAISYEEGIKQQQSLGVGAAGSSKAFQMKAEPVYAVDKKERECFRCRVGGVTLDHIKVCPTNAHKCEYCAIIGYWVKCCKQKFPHRKQEMKKWMQKKKGELRRIKLFLGVNSK